MARKLVECVPNFSEGRDMAVIDKIIDEIKKVKGVKLLDVDPGYDTNRTVVTFVGEPAPVKEAAFRAVKKSHELIDMSKHSGAHPRFGACDVCPLVPVSGITMEETVEHARELGKRLGEELNFPVFFYENAALIEERTNLAVVRKGEYEALESRLKDTRWTPDAGPAEFNAKTGATAVSARQFLVAYNINLNTVNPKKANYIAFRLREQGYAKREGGKIVKDENGKNVMFPGLFTHCKAIGWYVDDFKRAQISINLTDYTITNMHQVFDAASEIATKRGLRVTGSEIVGVVPKQSLVTAGRHYLEKQDMSIAQSDDELIKIAEFSLGLNDIVPFKKEEKVIEYMICDGSSMLTNSVTGFSDLLASDAPAPGGGSVAALTASLAAALTSMVTNLTYNKKGYKEHNEKMNKVGWLAQQHRAELLRLIDEDTNAFNIMQSAGRELKAAKKDGDNAAITQAKEGVAEANRNATLVPLRIAEVTAALLDGIDFIAKYGNVHAVSDAGVAALLVEAGVKSAALNVNINLPSLSDSDAFKPEAIDRLKKAVDALSKAKEIVSLVESKL
ncbi:glutamate formimidoyltransferase [bacterium]|nr:glutamate formimidoyltransferase [bacterium]